jgi:hypothetical protein
MDRNQDEQLNMIRQLIALAMADNNMDQMERLFIEKMAALMGIEKSQLEMLWKEEPEYHVPVSDFDRIVQFHRMVLLMNIDLRVEKEELTFIKETGLKMGIRPEAIEEVLETMKQYPHNLIPPDALTGIFKRYSN